ncbi:MAG: hypothetical protein COA78_05990 [Blastopirellula sp.]|nr:MAG: hypothetical protein COA78_05990 [Blastopirellula sp.]
MAEQNHTPEIVESDETFSFPRKKKIKALKLDITPMIDVTFLLLIYFIVASTIETDQVKLPSADHGVAVSADQSVIITLVDSGKDGKALVYKGDGKDNSLLVTGTDIEVQEQVITDYVSAELSPGSGKYHVLVKAEKTVKVGEVSRIMKAAALGGDVEVQTIFVGVEESK